MKGGVEPVPVKEKGSDARPKSCQDGPIGRVRTILERTWWLILAALLGVTVFLARHIPDLDINANTDAFIEEESEAVEVYYETREEWGTDEYAILCVTADDWFTESGRVRMLEIESDLREVAFVERTMSVLDVPLLRQDPDRKPSLLSLRSHMKELRGGEIDLPAAGSELRTHELAVGNLISADGRSLNYLAFLSYRKDAEGRYVPGINERRHRMVEGVRAVAAKWSAQLDEPVRVSGIPIITVVLYENMQHDLVVFGIASLSLFTLAFLVVYRRLRFVVLPIVCCLLPVLGMVGGMAWLGIPVGFVSSNMPVLLFVLMLPYNVYFIERYRERRARHPGEDSLASTLAALRTIFLPCFFSCATTVASFVALGTSRIIPIQDFGRVMTVGMVVGFVVVFLFIASSSCRLRALPVRSRSGDRYRGSIGLVRWLERATLARPRLVLVLAACVLAGAVTGVTRISAENKFTSYFWPGTEVYEGLEFIDQQMGGTTWIEVVMNSEENGYFRRGEGLRALEVVEDYFEELPETGNILSLTDLRDEMRKTLRKEWFPLLGDSALLGMVNLASPELVSQLSNSDFTHGRVTIRMKETAPTLNRNDILNGLKAHLSEHEQVFQDVDVNITGVFPVYAELLNQLLRGQRETLLVVPLAVLCMLILLFRSPVLAVLVLIPQALPVTILLGVMGWTGIPLDLVTVMIASIAIGVGIDAAIQYTIRFRRELEECGDHRVAVQRSHATIGRAIWTATSIIVAGFAVLVLSRFFPSVWFGLFTALAMLISQLATLTVLPSLFLLTGYPRRKST